MATRYLSRIEPKDMEHPMKPPVCFMSPRTTAQEKPAGRPKQTKEYKPRQIFGHAWMFLALPYRTRKQEYVCATLQFPSDEHLFQGSLQSFILRIIVFQGQKLGPNLKKAELSILHCFLKFLT